MKKGSGSNCEDGLMLLHMTDENKKRQNNPLYVASLEKAMRILEVFDEGYRRLSLTDMVKLTGLNKSAVQRFLHTWEALGYITRDSKTKQIRLSPKTMSLGYNFLRGERLVEVATPFLLEARERTGNSVYLGTLYDTSIIYLIRLPQRLLLLEGTLPGRQVPAFAGAGLFYPVLITLKFWISCSVQNAPQLLLIRLQELMKICRKLKR